MILRERLVKPLSWPQMSASYMVPIQCKIVFARNGGVLLIKVLSFEFFNYVRL